jgi:hypothetical protein
MAKRISTPPKAAELALAALKGKLLSGDIVFMDPERLGDGPMRLSLAEIAKELGITRQAVSGWHAIPAEWVKKIAELTGIPPHQLRPDLYDAPPPSRSRRAAVG